MIGSSYPLRLLQELLAQAEVQHRVISQNIANVNTPGYRAQEAAFGDILEQVQRGERGEPRVIPSDGLPVREDGNNVHIDLEMTRLTKNSLQFATYAQVLSTHLNMIRSAITGRT